MSLRIGSTDYSSLTICLVQFVGALFGWLLYGCLLAQIGVCSSFLSSILDWLVYQPYHPAVRYQETAARHDILPLRLLGESGLMSPRSPGRSGATEANLGFRARSATRFAVILVGILQTIAIIFTTHTQWVAQIVAFFEPMNIVRPPPTASYLPVTNGLSMCSHVRYILGSRWISLSIWVVAFAESEH